MAEKSVGYYLNSENPLTREAAMFLLTYEEEDDRIDYKQTFDPNSEKEWLEITKDVSSFANTHGGYLVFGVRDSDKHLLGLKHNVSTVLKEINIFQQKINRYLEPHVTTLRSKAFVHEGKKFVVMNIPRSNGVTHLISKHGDFTFPSGKTRQILHKGNFYVRRSSANHLADSRDLDDVLERRIDQFRDALMEKVARVVKAPQASDVYILSENPEGSGGKHFIIEDSPDAVAVKGMGLTITPHGPEEEIAVWKSLSGANSKNAPPALEIWKWYASRESIQIGKAHKLAVMQFSLWRNMPSFYWIQGLKSAEIRSALIDAVRLRSSNDGINEMLMVASFLGKGVYSSVLEKMGSYRDRVSPAMASFPSAGPRAVYGTKSPKPKQTVAQLKKEQKEILDQIAIKAVEGDRIPPITKRWKAVEIDCFLYAEDGQYK